MARPKTKAIPLRWNWARERRAFLWAGLVSASVIATRNPSPSMALGFLAVWWMGSLLVLRYAWVERSIEPGAGASRCLVALGAGATLCLVPTTGLMLARFTRGDAPLIVLPGVFAAIAAAVVLVRGVVAWSPNADGQVRWRFRAACAAAGTLGLLLLAGSQENGNVSPAISVATWIGVPPLIWGVGKIPECLQTRAHLALAVAVASAVGTYSVSLAAMMALSGVSPLPLTSLPPDAVITLLMAVLAILVLIAAAIEFVRLADREDQESEGLSEG